MAAGIELALDFDEKIRDLLGLNRDQYRAAPFDGSGIIDADPEALGGQILQRVRTPASDVDLLGPQRPAAY